MNLPTPPARIFDVTRDNFETDVLRASLETPVLIDFWASWCGPCKALGPVLEKLAEVYQGAFRLGKIDVDAEQELAGMFGIRSIPTVMLVMGGKPVDGFAGALPEGEVREFLARHLEPALANVEPAGQAAVLDEPAASESLEHKIERLRGEITEQPESSDLRLELARALLQDGQIDAVDSELATLPAELATDARATTLRSQLEWARTLLDAPDTDTLQHRISMHPDDWEAHDLLGVRLLLGPEPDTGLEQFLHVLEHAPDWNDGQAKKRLLVAFGMLDDAALVSNYRRRMTSLLF
ncbi:MAG TPA: thioredoxin [Rhodanobacteraceae bacterium]